MFNGPERFGWLSRLLHWAMAVGILFMLGLGTYIEDMEVSLSSLWLFALHKSIGITLLGLLVVRVLWHLVSAPPAPIGEGVATWQLQAARLVHCALYALMFLVPLSGWIASGATGLPVQVWGMSLPALAPVSEPLEKAMFAAHGILTKLLFLIVAVHALAAVQRQVIKRDGTLSRMLLG